MKSIYNPDKKPVLLQDTRYWLLFLGILALYGFLIVPTLGRMGIGWDEEIDLRIARAYLTPRGFFFGIPLDLSQTRLPTFSVALVYRLLGADGLLTARWTSVAVGGLTLLGIYVYGKEQFSHVVGLLAAGLLAVSPFFLAFARLAFTESDIYLACTLTWLMVAVARLQKKPAVGQALVGGLILGLSISAKATVLVIVPALWAASWVIRLMTVKNRKDPVVPAANSVPGLVVWFWSGWAVFVLVSGLYSGIRLNIGAYPVIYQLLRYGLVCLGWLIPLGWAFRNRDRTADHLSLLALVTSIGILTFVIFPPDHLTNSGILRSLFSRAENEMSLDMAFIGEMAALHLLAIFFKSTPVLGFALFGGTVASLAQWRRSELMLPLLVVVSYFAGLLLLPLGQTFYTIPILPALSLLLADQFVRLWSHRRTFAIAAAVLMAGWWGIEMIQCYPDYHLNGYQWLGERVLFGRSSIGYRSVVYTPSDGVEQAIEWLNTNAEPGETAQLYVSPRHIVRYVAPDPAYLITNGFEETISARPDFLVLHINALLSQGHGMDTPEGGNIRNPFDYETLAREYEQVFVERRAFDLEVASVWQRKSSSFID